MDLCCRCLLLLLAIESGWGQQEVCSKSVVNSCDDCIQSGPFCLWCKQLNFTDIGEQETVRCDTEEKLLKRGCRREEIISPKNQLIVERKDALSTSFTQEEPIQLSPQQISLSLRPGLPHTFSVSFKRVEGYPVDLYYLMDLSYSMKDDLLNVKGLGEDLFNALNKITRHGQIGFGAFVDKTVLPYTNTNAQKLQKPCDEDEQHCQAAFGYRHVLSLTPSEQKFKQEVNKQQISGNLDIPEGSLDAMMQAAVCGDKIGWRNSSTRLIVLTTDAGFHMAGDGKLAGILEPNDERCHMFHNIYQQSSHMDYPSVGQLARQLEKNNIQPIFAVTKDVEPIYKHLSQMIPKSEVGVLSSDSNNVVSLIEGAYKRLSSKVTLTHNNLPEDIRVQYTPICADAGPAGGNEGVCNNIHEGKEISFNVTVTAEKCMSNNSFTIRPLGIKDTLTVKISTQCDCHCDDPPINNHVRCSGQGKINCGICSCNGGFVGQFCNCSVGNQDEKSLRVLCKKDNGVECEGRGDCECGRCKCHTTENGGNYYGKYCECDDEHCEKFQNKLCGGNGTCKCGTCKCNKGYDGSACQCKTSTEGCQAENEAKPCSGRGKCICNRCHCNDGYQPPRCEVCLGCTDPCKKKQDCAECRGFSTGPFKEKCDQECSKDKFNFKLVEQFNSTIKGKLCHMKDSEGCWMDFKLKQEIGEDNYYVEILKERDCPKPPSIAAIISGSLVGVALIGILILMLLKFLIYLKDLKEFRKFENDRKKSKWAEANNPLFRNATTTVTNPTFTGE